VGERERERDEEREGRRERVGEREGDKRSRFIALREGKKSKAVIL
jgi:hypothetical protein